MYIKGDKVRAAKIQAIKNCNMSFVYALQTRKTVYSICCPPFASASFLRRESTVQEGLNNDRDKASKVQTEQIFKLWEILFFWRVS